MISPLAKWRAQRARTVAAASGVLGIVSLGFAVASCAEDSPGTEPPEAAITLPEAGSPPADLDASADGSPDADCTTAGDGGCTTHELTCAEADFCAVPTAVDDRYALLDVWGSSANDVWAVGSGGTVIHWDGAAWKSVPVASKDTLRGVGGSSANDVWIVSSLNVILHGSGFKNGAATFALQPPIHPHDPTNFTGALVTNVWSAGPGATFVGGPATRTWPEDSIWRARPVTDAGAEADPPPPAWEAASTYCQVRPCQAANAIWGTSASDLWVVGENGGLRRSKGPVGDGGGAEQWTTVKTTLTLAELRGIWGSSASDVWIVGDAGTIRHWSNDASQRWEIVPSPTTEDLRAVWGSGPNDAWAVGDAGTILHWDGKTWSVATATLPLGPKPRLYGVWGSGPNDVWVVGESIALHFTGAKPPVTTKAGKR